MDAWIWTLIVWRKRGKWSKTISAGPDVQDNFDTLSDDYLFKNSKDDDYTHTHTNHRTNILHQKWINDMKYFYFLKWNKQSLNRYLTRLRQQTQYCSFTNVDAELIDQIIHSCSSSDFRMKCLEKEQYDKLTLDYITNSRLTQAIWTRVILKKIYSRNNELG